MPFWIYAIISVGLYITYQVHLRKKAELDLLNEKQGKLLEHQKDLDNALKQAQADVDNVKHKTAEDLTPGQVEDEWNKKK